MMNSSDLKKREELIGFHLKAALQLVTSTTEESQNYISAINAYIKASTSRCGLDRLYLAFNWLMILGEINNCPPKFYKHLSAAATQLQDKIDDLVKRDFTSADWQLRRVETDLQSEDESVEQWSRSHDLSLQDTRTHFLEMAAYSAAQSIDLLRRVHSYGYMAEEKKQSYLDLIDRFKLSMPVISRLGLNIPHLLLTQIKGTT